MILNYSALATHIQGIAVVMCNVHVHTNWQEMLNVSMEKEKNTIQRGLGRNVDKKGQRLTQYTSSYLQSSFLDPAHPMGTIHS